MTMKDRLTSRTPSLWSIVVVALLLAAGAACTDEEPSRDTAPASTAAGETRTPEGTPVPAPSPAPPDAAVLVVSQECGLCAVRLDGTDPVRLSDRGFQPAWSPDRTRVAYHATVDGGYGLFVVDADGSDRRLVTEHRGVHNPVPPAWSPDGRTIAIESASAGDGRTSTEIWLVNSASGEKRILAEHSAGNSGPAWSPDGRRIAFQSDRDGNSDIWLVEAGGAGLTNLTRHAATDIAPAWLPDGRIAFLTDRDGNWEIYVTRLDGSAPHNLTRNAAWDGMAPVGHHPPAVSPDGRRLAFVSNRDGNAEVYVVDSDGQHLTRVTDDPASDDSPAWLPDSAHVAFNSSRGTGAGVWVAGVDRPYLGRVPATRIATPGSDAVCRDLTDCPPPPDRSRFIAKDGFYWIPPWDDRNLSPEAKARDPRTDPAWPAFVRCMQGGGIGMDIASPDKATQADIDRLVTEVNAFGPFYFPTPRGFQYRGTPASDVFERCQTILYAPRRAGSSLD